jgi:hypothetical protein
MPLRDYPPFFFRIGLLWGTLYLLIQAFLGHYGVSVKALLVVLVLCFIGDCIALVFELKDRVVIEVGRIDNRLWSACTVVCPRRDPNQTTGLPPDTRLVSSASTFYLVLAIAAGTPFLGPTLIKHGIPQSVLMVVGFGSGYLLGYLVCKQADSDQNRA